ncbi:MAG TPA: hypothetical protein VFK37_01780, partial [Bacillales bacterium]|nr:hypothetical protein [Bacillales bacterium]
QSDSSAVTDIKQKQPTEPKPHGSNDQTNDTLKNDNRAKKDHSKIGMAIDHEPNNNKSNQTHGASSKEQNVGSQKHESSSQSTPVKKGKLKKQNEHANKQTKKWKSKPHKAKQSHLHRNENGIHKNNRKYNEKKKAPEKSSSQHQNSDSKNDDNHMNNHSRKRQRVKMTSYIHDKILGSHPVWLPILNDFDRKTESQR